MADEVSRLRAIYEADSSGFDRALDSIQGGIGKTVGALAGLAGAIGVSFAAGDTIQRALEYDKALANIRSVTGDTAEETAALGEMLKTTAMNSAIPDGLNAISASYYDIVGGVSDASARQDIFNAAIATAEAGQASLQGVTSGLVSAMNAYSSTNLTAAYASDILTKTVGMGVGTMDQFVAAMGPISGVMASAGVDFQDMGAAMAFMTTKGTSASQAATRMQAATVSLINPNKEMIELFKKAGITSGTAAIEQYGLAGTLDKLKEAAGGSTEGMTKALGSVEALGAAVALTDEGFKGFSDTFLESAEGATAAARALQLESVSAQFEVFKNTLSGIGLSIGQAFLPALNTLLGGFNAFAQDVQKMGLGGAIEKWWNAGIGWLQTNGPAILQTALQTALDIGQDIVTFVQTYGPNVVAGAIGLWEGLKTWFSETGSGLFQDALKAGLQIAQDIGAFFIANAPNIVWGIMDWAEGAWAWLRDTFGGLLIDSLKQGLALITDITGVIAGAAPDIGQGIGDWIRGGLTWLTTEAPKLIQDAIAGLFSQPMDTSGMQGGDMAADLLPPPSVFEQMAQGAVDAMFNVFNTGLGLITGLFDGIFGLKKGTVKQIFDSFFGKDGVVSKAFEEGKKFVNGFMTKLEEIGGAITGAFSAAFDIITAPFREALKWIGNAIVQMANSLPDAFAAVRGDMLSVGQALVNFGTSQVERMGPFKESAMGNHLNPNETSWVGERGVELFTAGSSGGDIIPNSQIGGGGGGLTLHGVSIYGVENPEMFLDKMIEEARKRGIQLVM